VSWRKQLSERYLLALHQPVQAHQAMSMAWMDYIKPMLIAGHKLDVSIKPETRSDAQNRRLWSLLTDLSRQVDWYGQKLTPDEWKDVMTAALKKERVVPGINGGFVVLGQRTSKMTIKEMIELQELIEAFGADKGVMFKAMERIDMETGEIQ
jgi:hypothetical protein